MKSLIKVGLVYLLTVVLSSAVFAQSLRFAFVTDTHVGNSTGAEDLQRTVHDINGNADLEFVVVTGDITEFGSDTELKTARQILDSLNKPWYVIAGNHDSNWSESGANSFRQVFGGETFSFVRKGYLFVATSSGPNMRMGPGQVPRENLVWLDSVLANMEDPQMPVIYINHYPQDSSQNNWYETIDRVKKHNVQLLMCGHGHANHLYNFEGIPGVMGRSNLRAKDSIGGYNIVTISNGKAVFEERRPLAKVQKKWLEVELTDNKFPNDTSKYFRPSYEVNSQYPNAKVLWQYQDKSDVGAGTTFSKGLVVATNTMGEVYALNAETGERKWVFKTGGKIYSTPAVQNKLVVVGSSDNHIYCLDLSSGEQKWKFAAMKAVLGSPVIKFGKVFIGSSDRHFRCLDLKSGKLLWDFDQVQGFVVTRPLIYNNTVYFGCWANDFYALDISSGKLVWKWNNGSSNRMFSPAACYPVAANGRVFIVAPDRYMTAFDAHTGSVLWRKQMKDKRVRESMGLSADRSMVYVKTMDGEVLGISTKADSMKIVWQARLKLPYELDPSAIVEHQGLVYVPSHSGLAVAVERKTGRVVWKHKSSNALLNPVMPVRDNTVVLSTMDGKLTCLKYTKE